MKRGCVAAALVIGLWPAVTGAAAFKCDAEFSAQHGVTLYLPFEDTPQPQFSRTRSRPTYCDSVAFVDGKIGRAALLRRSREREWGKKRGRASGLNFDASGLLYGERGAVAFWFQPQWDGDDPTIRNGPNSTGPSLFSVSSLEPTYYQTFIRWQVKGGAFYIWVVDSDGKWHGPNYGGRVKEWRKGQWRHLAFTWDCAQGVRFFDNGCVAYDTWGKEQWVPATPWTIGIASPAPQGKPATVCAADMVVDELFLFDRALGLPDVRALMRGDYGALSAAPSAKLSEHERQARAKRFCLGPSAGRIAALATRSGWAARARLVEIREIRTRFIEGRFLSDGLTTRRFRLAQGGLTFDRDVDLILEPEARASYALLVGKPAPGSVLKTAECELGLAAGPDEAQRLALSPPAAALTLVLKAGSSMGECQLFEVPEPSPVEPGVLRPLGLVDDPASLGAAAQPLWQNLCAADRRALVESDAAPPAGTVALPALGTTHLMSMPADRDTGVAAIRLRLALRRPSADTAVALKVHDPFEPSRFRLLLDMALPATDTAEPRADIELEVPGLILPRGQRLWIELVADRQVELIVGPGASAMALLPRPVAEVRDAFSRSYLRFLNDEFRSRMAHNFMYHLRGVQRTNPLTVGLANILRLDPTNARALDMHHWARLSPWPKWTGEPPGQRSAPRWARLQRAVVSDALATIHWWIDHRQDSTGYMVGNANEWNDDTKLFNEYAVFALLTGDQKLTAAMERYLDAHYASGRMDKGYSKPLTDAVHSQEEASYLVPTLALLRYGDPVQVERLMETAANIPFWTCIVGSGRRHFRSSYYTATRMRTEGRFGRDVPLNASSLVPATYLVWYNGHPTVRQWLVEYAEAWREAARKVKPAGLLPSYVDSRGGQAGPPHAAYYSVLGFQLLAAAQLTGDLGYLEPVEAMLKHRGARAVYTMGLNVLEWRRLTGSQAYDGVLLEHAKNYRSSIQDDKFFQRGVEGSDVAMVLGHMLTGEARYVELGLMHTWRNNARARTIYTETDPDKDRVYPWGRVILPWMMCGGNAINARASAPMPTIAVSWEGTGTEFAAWVKEGTRSELRILAFNFGPERDAAMRVWRLAPGDYRVSCRLAAARDALDAREVRVRRGALVPLRLPSQQLVEITAEQTKELPVAEGLPDAAVSKAEILRRIVRRPDGAVQIVVPVHNLGTRPLPETKLRVLDARGRVLSEKTVPAIDPPNDLRPKVRLVGLDLPAQTAYPVTVEVHGLGEQITEENDSCVLDVPWPSQDPSQRSKR